MRFNIRNIKDETEQPPINVKKKKKIKINSKQQIFNITLTGILLGLAVAFSLIEIPIQFMGVVLPLRIFDSLIIAFALPVIGFYYTLAIGIIEPWLHFLVDSDHPPIQIFFDNIANILFIVSFYFIYYYLFKLGNKSETLKIDVIKKVTAGLVIIPLNAIIATLSFVLTLVVLYFSPNLARPGEYNENITSFINHIAPIFFILIAIEILRFIFIFSLFSLVERKIAATKRYYF